MICVDFSLTIGLRVSQAPSLLEGRFSMVEKVFTSSAAEVDRLKKAGYAIVAMSSFLPDGAFTYTLEKGSKWSRMLGSR